MDNGTGVAVALAIARAFAGRMNEAARGLRVCLFSAEEWALAGSQHYLENMAAAERESIALNVNLDTVAGDDRLTALTSEFPRLDAFVRAFAADESIDLGTYLPTMSNSDHYNFAQHGIPALRLVAGFDRPQSNIRYILTRGDTRDKVERADLEEAARIAAIARVAGADDERRSSRRATRALSKIGGRLRRETGKERRFRRKTAWFSSESLPAEAAAEWQPRPEPSGERRLLLRGLRRFRRRRRRRRRCGGRSRLSRVRLLSTRPRAW